MNQKSLSKLDNKNNMSGSNWAIFNHIKSDKSSSKAESDTMLSYYSDDCNVFLDIVGNNNVVKYFYKIGTLLRDVIIEVFSSPIEFWVALPNKSLKLVQMMNKLETWHSSHDTGFTDIELNTIQNGMNFENFYKIMKIFF
jgi:hypothetical protein